jgi:hypothetical protein
VADSHSTPWIRLEFVVDDDVLRVGYSDSRGSVVRPSSSSRYQLELPWYVLRQSGAEAALTDTRTVSVSWPTRASTLVFRLVQHMPAFREGPHGGGSVPLAVLVAPPPGSQGGAEFDVLTSAILQIIGFSSQKYVVGVEVPGPAPPPFDLPFDIADTTSTARKLRRFVGRLLGDLSEEQLRHAMLVHPISEPELRRAAPKHDIVVASMDAVAQSVLRRRKGPRLIIAGDPKGMAATLSANMLPKGTSLITLPFSTADRRLAMTKAVLRELVHDLPLHEVVLNAGRELDLDDSERALVHLWTSPGGLDSLRLQAAYERFVDRSAGLVRYSGVGRNLALPTNLQQLKPESARIEAALDAVRRASNDFGRESAGLTEMAQAEEARHQAQGEIDDSRVRVREIASAPDLAAELEDRQDRRVAIWLAHDPASLPVNRAPEINARTILARGQRYVVNVAIGLVWPTDLVAAGTPSLDPILPPSDDAKHEIRVAVFSDSATVLDQPAKIVILGRFGPAGPVTFLVQTHRKRRRMRLRVLIYYGHHVLQAFTVDARLADQESFAPKPALTVGLTYSRREQLRELGDIPARALCVATNADANGGTHRLLFDDGFPVRLSSETVVNAQKALRGALGNAFRKLGRADRLTDKLLASTVKSLAKDGKLLWKYIYDNGAVPLQDHLDGVRRTAGQTVQVLRLYPEYAFPWPMLYDWSLPGDVSAFERAPVCLGRRDGGLCSCTHQQTSPICVRGFWGLRLVIEELVRQGDVDEPLLHTAGAPGAPAVICALGSRDQSCVSVVKTLKAQLRNDLEDFAASRSLLDRMWDPAGRPAVLVAIGHLTEKQERLETWYPRIYVRAREKYLATDALTEHRSNFGRWALPNRPVVLLLACSSGRDEPGKLHSFVTTLGSAGAAAIVATEEKIDTRLAAAVAKAVIGQLATIGPGEALRAWRAEAMSLGNPCGMLFTCFGNADVTVPQLA